MKSNLRPMNWKQKLNKTKAMTDDLENELKKIMKPETRGLRFNDEKIRYDLIPPLAHRECAKVWTKGLDKYPRATGKRGCHGARLSPPPCVTWKPFAWVRTLTKKAVAFMRHTCNATRKC